jgi:glycine cleavage system aminomethyltransferase T
MRNAKAEKVSPLAGFFRSRGYAPDRDDPGSGFAEFDGVEKEWNAVERGVALRDCSRLTIVEASGEGSRALVDRLATKPAPQERRGAAAELAFLNAAGQTVAVADALLFKKRVVALAPYGDRLARWLARYVADEETTVRETGDDLAAVEFRGPHAGSFLTMFFGDAAKLAPGDAARALDDGAEFALANFSREDDPRFLLLAEPRAVIGALERALDDAGAFEPRLMGDRVARLLRLDKALPGAPEIAAAENLIEAGAERLVDFDKPAFIGREAIRDVRQKGTRRRLRAFCSEEPFSLDEPTDLFDERDELVGTLTSVAEDFRTGGALALGIVLTDRQSERWSARANGERRTLRSRR